MNIEQIIQKLLYKHDCVIVPEFGGFVAKKKPAIFHPMDYTFHPPSKKVGFNSNLKNTDGLLANALSKEYNVGYEEAVEQIHNIVTNWNKQLEEGRTVEIASVGSISIIDDHITFEAVPNQNFSIESFGLNSLKGEYILRDHKAIDESKMDTSNSWVSYAAAICFALLVGGSSYFANEKLVQPQLSSVFPLLNGNPIENVETAPIAPVIDLNSTSAAIAPIETSSNFEVDKTIVNSEVKPIQAQSPVVNEATNELDLSVKPFQVIGGSFKVYSRAMEHKAKLKREGYDRAIIIGKVGNFYMVAYDTFNNEKDAVEYKRSLEKQGHDVFMRP